MDGVGGETARATGEVMLADVAVGRVRITVLLLVELLLLLRRREPLSILRSCKRAWGWSLTKEGWAYMSVSIPRRTLVKPYCQRAVMCGESGI